MEIYLPLARIVVPLEAILLIGFTVGVLGGFFGIGGAFMVTPALNILGFPMPYAIGTDIAHLFGKSVVAACKHLALKHVDVKLGLWLGISGMAGVSIGNKAIMHLEKTGLVGDVVRVAYVFLLFGISLFMLGEYFLYYRRKEEKEYVIENPADEAGLFSPALALRRLPLPPFISFPRAGVSRISLWVIIGIGLLTGFVSGFLGVGGGFLRVPMAIYLLGLPTVVAIGTDLLALLITNCWGAAIYAASGRVELLGAIILLAGAAVGAQIGSLATTYIKVMKIRAYFAITVLLAGIAVLLKQLGYTLVSTWIIMLSALAMSMFIIAMFMAAVVEERRKS